MKKKIETIDEFYSFGCGRCEHGGTPECKTKTWKKELQALHKIALGCGLEEIEQAKDVASNGMRHDSSKDEKPQLPSELEEAFAAAPKLREAFFNLTPGRQRGYLIHFSQAKQSSTRRARIEKHTSRILQGIGFHDR